MAVKISEQQREEGLLEREPGGGGYCEGGPQDREWAEAVKKKRIMNFFPTVL